MVIVTSHRRADEVWCSCKDGTGERVVIIARSRETEERRTEVTAESEQWPRRRERSSRRLDGGEVESREGSFD